MELGLDAVLASTEEPSNKVRAVDRSSKGGSSSDSNAIMQLIAKLCLSNALASRALRSIIIQTFCCPSSHPLVLAHKEETTKYNEAAKKLREAGHSADVIRERIGLPHIQGWNGLLRAAKVALKQKENLKPQFDQLEQAITTMSSKGWTYQWSQVKFCKIEKQCDSSYKKSAIRVEEPSSSDGKDPWACWTIIKAMMQADAAIT